MNWFPFWINASLPLAALGCALVPVLIHIVRRKPARVIRWSTMEFLLDAFKQSRRRMQVSNLLLMLLRITTIVLLGIAAGSPFWMRNTAADTPRHQVILIDNSLSMNQHTPAGSALERAQLRAHELVSNAPDGSRFTIAQLASSSATSADPAGDSIRRRAADHVIASTTNKTEAHAAVDAVTVRDIHASAEQAVRIVEEVSSWSRGRLAVTATFLTDGADHTFPRWRAGSQQRAEETPHLPTIEVERLVEQPGDNVWISNLVLQDELIEPQTAVSIIASFRRSSRLLERVKVPVTLKVNNLPVATGDVDFQSGETIARIVFRHRFQTSISQGIDWQTVSVQVANDSLNDDNQLCEMVPVACQVPILFVDQGSTSEEETRGQTHLLRRMLERSGTSQPLQIRHLDLGQLSEQQLDGVRLLVLAGVADPSTKIELLSNYVHSGGQLLIFGGDQFDAAKWNQFAWKKGKGILPARFDLERLRDWNENPDSGEVRLLSLHNQEVEPLISWPNTSASEMQSLFGEVQFTRILPLDLGSLESDVQVRLVTNDRQPLLVTKHFQPQRESSTTESQANSKDVEGCVALFTSGLTSQWNSLSQSGAFLMFDRLMREMLRASLPPHNFVVGHTVGGKPIESRGLHSAQTSTETPGYCATGDQLESNLQPLATLDPTGWPEFSLEAPTAAVGSVSGNFWPWIALVALICLAVETWVVTSEARRQSRAIQLQSSPAAPRSAT